MAASAFDHRALPYESDDEFLSGLVPFVRAGLEDDGAVLAALGPHQTEILRTALGRDAERVRFVPMREAGGNPARIIPVWVDFVENEPRDRPLTGIGEPIWPGRRPEEIVECEHHEALLDLAFADGRGWSLLCPYDAKALPADLVARAVAGHASGPLRPGLLTEPLAPPPDDHLSRPFAAADRGLRDLIRERAHAFGLAGRAADDLMLAVHEIAANSINHGGGEGILRLWRSEDAVVAEVTDDGEMTDPLVGRRTPPPGQVGGRGVWVANALCDLVQIRSAAGRTTVRLHRRLDA